MKIHVHIDRLILDGLPIVGHSGPMIQDAVQAELIRLFAEGSVSTSLLAGGAIPSLRTATIQITPHSKPNALGHNIASAVHGGLQQ